MNIMRSILVNTGLIVPTAAELMMRGAPISAAAVVCSKAGTGSVIAPIITAATKAISKTVLGVDLTTPDGIRELSKAITTKIVAANNETTTSEPVPQVEVSDPLAE